MSRLLSPDDPNRKLAERIGRVLEEGGSVEDVAALDDEVVEALLAYRQSVRQRAVTTPPSGTEELWAGIADELAEPAHRGEQRARPDRAARRRQTTSDGRRRARSALFWRIGVATLVAAVIGVAIWLFVPTAETGLVAEAGSTVTTYETKGGATVRLRPQSSLHEVRMDGADRYRLTGEAAFSVPHQKDKPFEVVAKNAIVRVRGTRFVVRTWTENPEVYLEEGRVELLAHDRASRTMLRPGQWGRVTSDGSVASDSSGTRTYTDWLDGRISMDAREVGQVVDELEYHYAISIRIPDSIRTEMLSGTLVLKRSADETLQNLGIAIGGTFVSLDSDRYRFRSDSQSSGRNR